MIELGSTPPELAWPLALMLAWVAGEVIHRRIQLPRISMYAIVGFALAPTQLGLLPPAAQGSVLFLANVSLGLILFEAGHRFNLRWMRVNAWLAVSSATEAGLAFVLVYGVAVAFGTAGTAALLLAALSMATSPATILRVVNEQRSSGQVTERILHLSVMNCVLAVFVFKIVVGMTVFRTSGRLGEAIYSSLFVLAASAALGAVFGLLMPALLRRFHRTRQDSTLAFTLAVILLVSIAHGLKQSPVLATLTFGLLARHRRISMGPSERGFGALGDLMSLLLFVFVASTLERDKVLAGALLGLALIGIRLVAKVVGVSIYSRVSGISWRKGLLTGLALTPISAFVILVLEQTRHIGIDLVDQLSPLAAAALTLEIIGPVVTLYALRWAHETQDSEGH
ncbi:cation:proton antiporter [uncultured Sphaerotilus sp.]|uniref:cation:proton antiporter n=1 Tax=uncultured Sphaerotilus sp. TaxID=474984 RepID=UPI0030CA2E1D